MSYNKEKAIEDLENQLSANRTEQSLALGIIVQEAQKQPEVDENGKRKERRLSDAYYRASIHREHLLSQELRLKKQLDFLNPDLEFDVPEKYRFNPQGELERV